MIGSMDEAVIPFQRGGASDPNATMLKFSLAL